MLFQRSIALIYLIAFASLFPQLKALFLANGISPVQTLVTQTSFLQAPSLFQISHSDIFIQISCVLGMIVSSLVALDLLKAKTLKLVSFILLYVLYLSFVNTGGAFLSFQWDALLLETGFLMIVAEAVKGNQQAEKITTWLFWTLIFKLMFMSGLVKLTSGDKTWTNFTALEYHFQTQPLPNPLSVFFHNLPTWFLRSSCILMFAVELVLPFFIFFSKCMRHIAGLGFILLQLIIIISGNYCFFNLLTMALCIPLLDLDRFKTIKLNIVENSEDLMMANPGINSFLASNVPSGTSSQRGQLMIIALLITYSLISCLHVVNRSGLKLPAINNLSNNYLKTFGPYYLNSPYGLFAVMTTTRYEIIIQGANDIPGQLTQSDWLDYEFKYKPGKTDRIPAQIAPFQPRLDWQMWFAALSSYQNNPWFMNTVLKLLEGNKEVLKLFAYNPYDKKPPQYIRALIYEYKFDKLNSNEVWTRELKGLYLPSIRLKGSV